MANIPLARWQDNWNCYTTFLLNKNSCLTKNSDTTYQTKSVQILYCYSINLNTSVLQTKKLVKFALPKKLIKS